MAYERDLRCCHSPSLHCNFSTADLQQHNNLLDNGNNDNVRLCGLLVFFVLSWGTYRPAKTSWADEVDDLGAHNCPGSLISSPLTIYSAGEVPQITETVDKNGIITIVEYTTNEEGKKVKVSSYLSIHKPTILLLTENIAIDHSEDQKDED